MVRCLARVKAWRQLKCQERPGFLLGGGYTTVGYFFTGEHRPYDRKAGASIPSHPQL